VKNNGSQVYEKNFHETNEKLSYEMRGPPFFLVGGEGGGVFCSSCVWCGDWTVHFSLGSEFFMQVFFFSSFFWWFILGGPKEGTLYFKRRTSI